MIPMTEEEIQTTTNNDIQSSQALNIHAFIDQYVYDQSSGIVSKLNLTPERSNRL